MIESMTSRWSAPEIEEPVPGLEPEGGPRLVKRCPRCGEQMPAESRICHYCLTSLADVAPEPIELPPDAGPVNVWQRLRRVPARRWLQLIAVAALAGFIYTQCFWPAPSRDEASGSRSLSVAPQVWAGPGADPGSTRVTAASPPLHGETVWIRTLDSEITAPLVADETAIYVAHRDARLVAYATADGGELWTLPVPGQLDNSPVVAGDTLYAALRSGGLVAIEARSGRERWRSDTGQDILSGPMVVDGVVWVAGRGSMFAYDAENGELLGSAESGDTVLALGEIAVGAERVVFHSWRRLHFFSIESGQHEFFGRFSLGRHVAAGHGLVVGVSDFGMLAFEEDVDQPWWEGLRRAWFWAYLWGLAPPTPSQPYRWVKPLGCEPLAPVLQPEQVVAACANGRVLALATDDGRTLWELSGPRLVDDPTLIAQGLLLVEKSALVVVDPRTGDERDRRALEGVTLSQVLVTSGGVYITTVGGELRALR
ncbi:MAG: PQQ-binding-like beta-propeller repeat protein [Chloroflexi bacterium]|nr:PQQ-binding-like beta-propeller repeat protein [Chloroflexota bacterium]MYE45257.1 PQQ-binding-like beta-propeller repeat protein [Chloroflexota bacterium]